MGAVSDAQRLADEGQELAERDETAAEIAWNRFDQENTQYKRELSARFPSCTMLPTHEDYAARLEASTEYALWYKANRVPRPERTVPFRPLVLVGRGNNRSGPMSDG